MKTNAKTLAAIALIIALYGCEAGGNGDASKWMWVSGDNVMDQVGTYGTKGTANASNVPGAREGAVSWIDTQGKLWLFGGSGYSGSSDGYLNDLWKFDPTTLQWTWVSGDNVVDQVGTYGTKGTPAPSNVPGARNSAISWIDSSGGLWLFGGFGYDSGINYSYLNDLWKFDPTTLQWMWVSGDNVVNQVGTYGTKGIAAASNVPGARRRAVSWIDTQGKLWLFGGFGYDSGSNYGYLNDLWKFDPTTLHWTWVSGDNVVNQGGTYGTKGTADQSNVPGARSRPVSWIDTQGKLWLFGGYGYSGSSNGYLNDLWKFDPTTLQWTWVSGDKVVNQVGTYGTKGIAAASNVPGARSRPASWIDTQGKLWLFGGYGYSGINYGYLNDLWKLDPTTLQWTWVSGDKVVNQVGTYGTKGTADQSNVPGAREGAVSWIDTQGEFWLFGGYGYDSSSSPGYSYLNDLWRYIR